MSATPSALGRLSSTPADTTNTGSDGADSPAATTAAVISPRRSAASRDLPAPVVDLDRVRRRKDAADVLRLLHRREQLAAAVTAYTAHDLPGVQALWAELHELEESIAHRDPRLWRQQWPGWVEQDAARMHDRHDPSRCPLCPPGRTPGVGQVAA